LETSRILHASELNRPGLLFFKSLTSLDPQLLGVWISRVKFAKSGRAALKFYNLLRVEVNVIREFNKDPAAGRHHRIFLEFEDVHRVVSVVDRWAD